MANKKTKQQVESIRAELTALTEAVWALKAQVSIEVAAVAAGTATSANSARDRANGYDAGGRTRALENQVHDGKERGLLSAYGYFEAGDRGYRWARDEQSISTLLSLDDERAAQLLSALGNRQRIAMLKVILDKPSSAAELVEALDLGTTGAAYHHLNVLQAADLVTQESRGVYAFQGHRVPGFLLLLAGVDFSLNPSSTSGLQRLDGEREEGSTEGAAADR